MVALAAGDYHCLALRSDGTVVAWGDNSHGQTNVPLDLTNAVSVAAGSASSLALRKDGSVTVWGLIEPAYNTKVPSSVTNVVALAAGPGAQHALVLRADGTMVDWGNAYYGLTNIPPAARNIVGVAAGNFFALALRAEGMVVSWGEGPVVPSNATNIVAIATGWRSVAALRADGKVLAWGTITYFPQPGSSGFTNVVDLACPFSGPGNDAVLALRRNGSTLEWPWVASNPTNIVAVAAGSYDAMASIGSGPPVFPGIPVNRTVDSGLNAYFRMNAVGALPLSYQWNCNGTNIPGAINPVLVLTNVQPLQAGNLYSVTASNRLGTNTSGDMTLYESPSEVFVQPQNISGLVDGTAIFTATTIGQGPFSYQWQLNGTNLPAATNSVFTLTNLLPFNTGAYSVVVSNFFAVTTNFAALTVSPTIVTNLPQSQTVFPNGTVTLNLGIQAIIPVRFQ